MDNIEALVRAKHHVNPHGYAELRAVQQQYKELKGNGYGKARTQTKDAT